MKKKTDRVEVVKCQVIGRTKPVFYISETGLKGKKRIRLNLDEFIRLSKMINKIVDRLDSPELGDFLVKNHTFQSLLPEVDYPK